MYAEVEELYRVRFICQAINLPYTVKKGKEKHPPISQQIIFLKKIGKNRKKIGTLPYFLTDYLSY